MFEELHSPFIATMAWLVASSQTVVSVLSLKTVRMEIPWMLRGILVPILLSVLLLSPAAELYWLFLVQFLTILIFAAGGHWYSKRSSFMSEVVSPNVEPIRRGTFSLATMLFLTAVVAGVLGLMRITPEQNWRSINSLFFIGFTAGLVGAGSYLVVHWSKSGRLRSRIAKRSVWIFLAAVLAIPLAYFDWLLEFALGLGWGGWPPVPSVLMTSGSLINVLWFPIISAHAIAILVWLPLLSKPILKTPWKYLSGIATLAICFLPAFGLVQLLKPLSTQVDLPSSNAYEDITKLGRELKGASFGVTYDAYTDWDLVPKSEQVSVIAETEPLLERLRPLISQEYQVPIKYSWDDIDTDSATDIRMLSRALVAKSRLDMDIDPNRACKTLMLGVELTTRIRRGGLFIHCLVANASCDGLRAELVENRRYFSQAQCLKSAQELLDLIAEIEPPQTIDTRERIWSRACHWTSNISFGVSELFGCDLFETTQMAKQAMINEIAQLRLAALALATESFQKEYSRFPSSLDELSEKLQLALPLDPYSPTQQTFVYRLTDLGYMVYSLGPNRVDDGGIHDPNDFNFFRNDIPLIGVVRDPTIVPAAATGGPY